jgi:hypothetical protein
MKEVIAWIVVFILVVALAAFFKKNNVASWSAVNVNSLIYSKDSRTGICYAQGSSLLATVPCEKVKNYLNK